MNPSGYNPAAAEPRWQHFWEEHATFAPKDDGSRERRYVLDMFPYPSGDLHMGHAEAYAISDVVARYWKMSGYDVLHPIGWDSFGLPAENAAIRASSDPRSWTYRNIDTQAASFKRYGLSFDWSRRLHTSDPEYYRWTQWLFLRFWERGLAYRKKSYANWCPQDQTVLANEQIVDGSCERCGTKVTKRPLTQWYFRITEYADQLLDDMRLLESGWPEHVLAMQRNWISRSKGAYVDFELAGDAPAITVYTTRPDTLFGVTFLVVAPESELAELLVTDEQRPAFEAYLEEVKHRSDIEREASARAKTGLWLGRMATNPVNGEQIPIWTGDYVLSGYGTGAIMAVPAHDQRDLEFALAHGLNVRSVICPAEPSLADDGTAFSGEGSYQNSDYLDGLDSREAAISAVMDRLVESGNGRIGVSYRLRDWLVSRQRFWGCPIPIIYCAQCGEVPVPEHQLPVTLPDLRGAELATKGGSPLEAATQWRQVPCPNCGGPGTRDTDTMDTFVDSSWYFLRYCSPNYDDGPFDPAQVAKWLPVAQYVGGVEHAVLHLLYLRFFSKVLRDLGLVDFDEPILRLMNQGQVLNQGRAMSKSLGNGVDLGEQLDKYGVDAVRLSMVFAGPPEDDIDWADVSPAASLRFLRRAYDLAAAAASAEETTETDGDPKLRKATHQCIQEVTGLLDSGRFNVAIARIMTLVSLARRALDEGLSPADPAVRQATTFVAQAVSLFAPYLGEEMWQALGNEPSVADSSWPKPDPGLLRDQHSSMTVQIQGKTRAVLQVDSDITEEEAVRIALLDPTVKRHVAGRGVARVISRLPKLLSLVLED